MPPTADTSTGSDVMTTSSTHSSEIGAHQHEITVDNSVLEDPVKSTITGSVLTDDALNHGHTVDFVGALGVTHGTLILGLDGSYSYTLNKASLDIQHLPFSATLTDVFNYILYDTHGNPTSSTLNILIHGAPDPAILSAPSNVDILQTETPLNIALGLADHNPDLLMHITGLPTAVHASLNYGTLNPDGSYTLTAPDLNNLADLKLITDSPLHLSEPNGVMHIDLSSPEGESVLHTYADIHYSILP
jgi:VCBS repeat-containing protein